MQARDAPLELDKNLNKTMVVQNSSGRGPGQPGFYCETCSRTYKDTIGYLDHLNSRARKPLSNVAPLRIPLLTPDLRSTRTWSDDQN